jgi:hypothetical protein
MFGTINHNIKHHLNKAQNRIGHSHVQTNTILGDIDRRVRVAKQVKCSGTNNTNISRQLTM